MDRLPPAQFMGRVSRMDSVSRMDGSPIRTDV